MDDCRVWTVLDEQGRMVRWLARVTGIPAQRLYDCKKRGNWLRHEEAEAISRALGVPREMLFGPRARVLPPGRRTGRPGRKKKTAGGGVPQAAPMASPAVLVDANSHKGRVRGAA